MMKWIRMTNASPDSEDQPGRSVRISSNKHQIENSSLCVSRQRSIDKAEEKEKGETDPQAEVCK